MNDRTEIWAVIPARGGSKGIPGKNLVKIQGRPLVVRAVEAAKAAPSITRVIVTTDDPAIAAAASTAEIVIRPPALAGDEASSESALLHVLRQAEDKGEALPELLVFLQCTSPFIAPDDIEGTIAALQAEHADTAHTVAASHGFLWRRTSSGSEGINHDQRARLRRQEREAEYRETGAVYAMRVDGFRAARHRFFGKTVLFEVPALRSLEIDTPDDLRQARLLAPLLEPGLRAGIVPLPLGGVVFDFDGVMTDDTLVLDETGKEAVTVSRSDGFGIGLLRALGVKMAVISREVNPVVARRCTKLQIACRQAITDKTAALQALCAEWNTTADHIVFVGNDLPDLPCIAMAGLGVAVADAHPLVRAQAALTLTRAGGQGAVRELCDVIVASRRT